MSSLFLPWPLAQIRMAVFLTSCTNKTNTEQPAMTHGLEGSLWLCLNPLEVNKNEKQKKHGASGQLWSGPWPLCWSMVLPTSEVATCSLGMVYFSATNIPGKMLAVQEVYDHGKTAAPPQSANLWGVWCCKLRLIHTLRINKLLVGTAARACRCANTFIWRWLVMPHLQKCN